MAISLTIDGAQVALERKAQRAIRHCEHRDR